MPVEFSSADREFLGITPAPLREVCWGSGAAGQLHLCLLPPDRALSLDSAHISSPDHSNPHQAVQPGPGEALPAGQPLIRPSWTVNLALESQGPGSHDLPAPRPCL